MQNLHYNITKANFIYSPGFMRTLIKSTTKAVQVLSPFNHLYDLLRNFHSSLFSYELDYIGFYNFIHQQFQVICVEFLCLHGK